MRDDIKHPKTRRLGKTCSTCAQTLCSLFSALKTARQTHLHADVMPVKTKWVREGFASLICCVFHLLYSLFATPAVTGSSLLSRVLSTLTCRGVQSAVTREQVYTASVAPLHLQLVLSQPQTRIDAAAARHPVGKLLCCSCNHTRVSCIGAWR